MGIQEIRPIDAAKIRKVKEVKHKTDPATGAKLVDKVNEFYIYQDKTGTCLLYTSPSPRDGLLSRMPSSA